MSTIDIRSVEETGTQSDCIEETERPCIVVFVSRVYVYVHACCCVDRPVEVNVKQLALMPFN